MEVFKRPRNPTIFSVCLISFMLAQQLLAGAFSYPDFEQSMLRQELNLDANKDLARRKWLYENADPKMVAIFKEIYASNIAAAKEDISDEYRIPKIVHQIWLGSPVPEKFKEWMSSWGKLQGWEYMLWTEKEINALVLQNQDLYNQCESFAEKADIVRLEILYQFGGVYADVDYECINPDVFEELHRSFDFYIGFEPLEHGFTQRFKIFKVCNALIASKPGHPLVHDLITNMKANYYAYQQCCGPVERTGPSYLTRIICEFEKSHAHANRNMYFPCTFFYPFTQADLEYFIENPNVEVKILSETAGIHYWSGSWRKEKYGSL